MAKENPITFLDSNSSGLSALRILHRYLPHENYCYIMDTKTAPFSEKSESLVREQSQKLIRYAQAQDSKAFVYTNFEMAVLLSDSQEKLQPLYNLAHLAAKAALTQTQNNKVAVIGSALTLNPNVWSSLLEENQRQTEIHLCPTPLLFPIVQEQLFDDPLSNLLIYRYINPLLHLGVDTLILADTSYSWIQKSIQKVLGEAVTIIDSTELLVQNLVRDLNQKILEPNTQTISGHLDVLSSDLYPEDLVKRWLRPVPLSSYKSIDL